MFWVVVFVVIALGGLAMVICFGISLWRKSQALLDEVGTLLERADELAGLLEQLELPSDTDLVRRYVHVSDEDGAELDDAEMGLSAERAT
jgi:hypothetical protein